MAQGDENSSDDDEEKRHLEVERRLLAEHERKEKLQMVNKWKVSYGHFLPLSSPTH